MSTDEKPKIAYVVMEMGWEYNDEGYNDLHGNGMPKHFYFDVTEARRAMRRLSVDKAKSLGEDLGDYNNWDQDYEHVAELIGRDRDDIEWGWAVPKDASDDLIMDILSAAGIQFYEVIPVEVEY